MTRRIEILGVGVDLVDVEDLHREILTMCRRTREAGEGCDPVLNVNANCLNLAWNRPWLRRALNEASLVFCDGAGVAPAARTLGQSAPIRITYADWTWRLAGFAAREGLTMYLLGAGPGITEEAARSLRRRHPALRIAGTAHGYFDKSAGSPENEAALARISAAGPDILVVGFGMPLQERWISETRHEPDCGVVLAGGAAFDYVSGRARRGPPLLTDNGLEWLARLAMEPRRLWRRYVIGNPVFLSRVIRARIFGLRPPGREDRRRS